MSEESSTTAETTATEQSSGQAASTAAKTTAAQSATDSDATDYKAEAERLRAEVDKWKGLSRKHEGQAKDNSAAAGQVKTLEERLASLEKANSDAEMRAMRAEVAQAKGLTAAQAKYLAGSTREEMEAAADELKTAFKSSDTPDLRRRPSERLRPGSVPDATPDETDPAKLAAKVPRG
jgi:hypothetical protein